MRNSPKQINSYRQRRALSKSSNQTVADTKGLEAIEESLKLQNSRVSFPESATLNDSLSHDDSRDEWKPRLSTETNIEDKEGISIAKIILKYGIVGGLIKEVNQDDSCLSNVMQNTKPLKPSLLTASTKNLFAADNKKLVQAKTVSNRAGLKSDLGCQMTPKKTPKQTPTNTLVTLTGKIEKKQQRKAVSKLQQGRYMKKVELLGEEIGRLGFEKAEAIREHLRAVTQLMRE